MQLRWKATFSPLHPPGNGHGDPQSARRRRHISYFGPEANDFGLLEQTSLNTVRAAKGNLANICIPTTSRTVESGTGDIHPLATFTGTTDVLFYEGLHGGVVTPQHNLRSMWTYWSAWCLSLTLSGLKTDPRHQRARALTRSSDGLIVRSMEDYINYITPQFSRTHLTSSAFPPSTLQTRSRQKVSVAR